MRSMHLGKRMDTISLQPATTPNCFIRFGHMAQNLFFNNQRDYDVHIIVHIIACNGNI